MQLDPTLVNSGGIGGILIFLLGQYLRQRRNGNGYVRHHELQASIDGLKETMNKGFEGVDKGFENVGTRIQEARKWVGDLDKRHEETRNTQEDVRERLSKLEGRFTK